MNRHSAECKIPDNERCQALLKDSYGRQTKDRCHHFSTVIIDEHRMCQKHACLYALQLMLENGTAQHIPYTKRNSPHLIFE